MRTQIVRATHYNTFQKDRIEAMQLQVAQLEKEVEEKNRMNEKIQRLR